MSQISWSGKGRNNLPNERLALEKYEDFWRWLYRICTKIHPDFKEDKFLDDLKYKAIKPKHKSKRKEQLSGSKIANQKNTISDEQPLAQNDCQRVSDF